LLQKKENNQVIAQLAERTASLRQSHPYVKAPASVRSPNYSDIESIVASSESKLSPKQFFLNGSVVNSAPGKKALAASEKQLTADRIDFLREHKETDTVFRDAQKFGAAQSMASIIAEMHAEHEEVLKNLVHKAKDLERTKAERDDLEKALKTLLHEASTKAELDRRERDTEQAIAMEELANSKDEERTLELERTSKEFDAANKELELLLAEESRKLCEKNQAFALLSKLHEQLRRRILTN
jgi:iron-sulfur cluster repair protein YtfE (RIC family)